MRLFRPTIQLTRGFARRGSFVGGVAVGILAAGGIVYAAIPNSTTGQITACYGTDKVLKVVDSTCPKGTTKLTWQSKGVRFVGPWSATRAYQPSDIVTSSGSSYIALLAHTNKAVTNSTYWAVFAAKGGDGAKGTDGIDGAGGDSGAPAPRYGRTIVYTKSFIDPDAVGRIPSLAVGIDGHPIISFYDPTNRDLKIAFCANIICTTATYSAIDVDGNVGLGSSIAIGADGSPVIAYYDRSTARHKVAVCLTPMCEGVATTPFAPESSGNTPRWEPAIAIGANGNPVIAYYDVDNQDLAVATCSDPLCTSVSIATVDGSGTNVGMTPAITIGVNDNPVISYYDVDNQTLKLASCTNPTCAASTITTVDSTTGAGAYSAIAIGANGFPTIAYYEATSKDVRIAVCGDTTCETKTTTTISDAGDVGRYVSLAIGPDEIPVLAFMDYTNGDLKYAKCTNSGCASTVVLTIDSERTTGSEPTIAISANGNPVISYFDDSNSWMKFAMIARSSWTKYGGS